MQGLQDQDLEHAHRIKRRAAALAAIAVSQSLDQPRPEMLEIHRALQNLERIAVLAQGFEVIVQAQKRMRVMMTLHDWATSVNHDSQKGTRGFLRVSSCQVT